MGNIGETERTIEIEPLEEPMTEPAPAEPAPAEPEPEEAPA